MRIYVINGYPRSGKDSFVEFCGSHTTVVNMSTVDCIKRALTAMGWDGNKTPENRQRLSDIKGLAILWFDGPYNDVVRRLKMAEAEGADIAFVHCREPQEIQKFVDRIGAKSVYIDRKYCEPAEHGIFNHADTNVRDFAYDYEIDNNGTIEDLMDAAERFVEEEMDM